MNKYENPTVEVLELEAVDVMLKSGNEHEIGGDVTEFGLRNANVLDEEL